MIEPTTVQVLLALLPNLETSDATDVFILLMFHKHLSLHTDIQQYAFVI